MGVAMLHVNELHPYQLAGLLIHSDSQQCCCCIGKERRNAASFTTLCVAWLPPAPVKVYLVHR